MTPKSDDPMLDVLLDRLGGADADARGRTRRAGSLATGRAPRCAECFEIAVADGRVRSIAGKYAIIAARRDE